MAKNSVEAPPLGVYEFDMCIYPRKLFVVDEKNKDVVTEYFSRRDGQELNVDSVGPDSGSCSVKYMSRKSTGNYGALVWILDDRSPGSMAHEAVHVADGVFEDLGIDSDGSNDEHYAYLVGWIVEKLVNIAEKTGKYEANRI